MLSRLFIVALFNYIEQKDNVATGRLKLIVSALLTVVMILTQFVEGFASIMSRFRLKV